MVLALPVHGWVEGAVLKPLCVCLASVRGVRSEGSAAETLHPKKPGSVQVLVHHQLNGVRVRHVCPHPAQHRHAGCSGETHTHRFKYLKPRPFCHLKPTSQIKAPPVSHQKHDQTQPSQTYLNPTHKRSPHLHINHAHLVPNHTILYHKIKTSPSCLRRHTLSLETPPITPEAPTPQIRPHASPT